jgi:hypothetical protein
MAGKGTEEQVYSSPPPTTPNQVDVERLQCVLHASRVSFSLAMLCCVVFCCVASGSLQYGFLSVVTQLVALYFVSYNVWNYLMLSV